MEALNKLYSEIARPIDIHIPGNVTALLLLVVIIGIGFVTYFIHRN